MWVGGRSAGAGQGPKQPPPPPQWPEAGPVQYPPGLFNVWPDTSVPRGTGRMGPAPCGYAKGLTSDQHASSLSPIGNTRVEGRGGGIRGLGSAQHRSGMPEGNWRTANDMCTCGRQALDAVPMNWLENHGSKCLWQGHPAQPMDQARQ